MLHQYCLGEYLALRVVIELTSSILRDDSLNFEEGGSQGDLIRFLIFALWLKRLRGFCVGLLQST